MANSSPLDCLPMSNLTSLTSSSHFFSVNGGAAFSAPKSHGYLFDEQCQLVFVNFCSLFIGGQILQIFRSSFPFLNVTFISSIVHGSKVEEIGLERFRKHRLVRPNRTRGKQNNLQSRTLTTFRSSHTPAEVVSSFSFRGPVSSSSLQLWTCYGNTL